MVSDDLFVHVDRTPTQADWDALDPNSYETDCRSCGAYLVGQFGPAPDRALEPCPHCGSKEHGAVSSPAGGEHLLLWSGF